MHFINVILVPLLGLAQRVENKISKRKTKIYILYVTKNSALSVVLNGIFVLKIWNTFLWFPWALNL